MQVLRRQHETRTGLYTDAERGRRDTSPWTLVQAILAPLQFLVFMVSLGLVLRTLATGEGTFAAVIGPTVRSGSNRNAARQPGFGLAHYPG